MLRASAISLEAHMAGQGFSEHARAMQESIIPIPPAATAAADVTQVKLPMPSATPARAAYVTSFAVPKDVK
jgi:hypothetical protein